MQAKPKPELQPQPVIGDDGELLAEDQGADVERYADFVHSHVPHVPLAVRLREHFAEWRYLYFAVPTILLITMFGLWSLSIFLTDEYNRSWFAGSLMLIMPIAIFLGLCLVSTKISWDQIKMVVRFPLTLLETVLRFLRHSQKWIYTILACISIIFLANYFEIYIPTGCGYAWWFCYVGMWVLFVFKPRVARS